MKFVEHLMTPEKLLVIWQIMNPQNNENNGKRFVVGEVRAENGNWLLEYYDNEDTKEAIKHGHFSGMTAYPYEAGKIYNGNVKDILSKRVASPGRSDYPEYLRSYRIPPEQAGRLSTMQILAYTRGELTGDGFSFFPDLENMTPPFDLVIEIAGFRHCDGMEIHPIQSLLGKEVRFVPEPENDKDPDAIAIYTGETKLGYVPRGYSQYFAHHALGRYDIAASITKINGTLERPKISALVQVKPM